MATRTLVEAIEGEYLRYKKLGEDAMAQLADAQLVVTGPGDANSIAVIVWHVAGNLRSRFTDFLTSDGEKPWRKRDEEFESRDASRAEILRTWDDGWAVLLDTLNGLDDGHLAWQVTIRSQPLFVREALLRSLAHASYHVGQIVLLAKTARGSEWKSLSIPRGQSAAYNLAPSAEAPPRRIK